LSRKGELLQDLCNGAIYRRYSRLQDARHTDKAIVYEEDEEE
jgi:hypothetical protein